MVPVKSGNLLLHIIVNPLKSILAFIYIVSGFFPPPHWFLWSFPFHFLRLSQPLCLDWLCHPLNYSLSPNLPHLHTHVLRSLGFRRAKPGVSSRLSFFTSSVQSAAGGNNPAVPLCSCEFMIFILFFQPVFKRRYYFRAVLSLQGIERKVQRFFIYLSPHANLPQY